jgi:uncharacterized HAD superfamily protein/hypoxanthine phosphoribosyltransferase
MATEDCPLGKWHGKVKSRLPDVVAVVGVGRSGTSCVAGMLSKLGVTMGDDLKPADAHNPRGYYEDNELLRFMESGPKTNEETVEWLRDWLSKRRGNGIVGCKHPWLCDKIPEMREAWPNVKIVATSRYLDDVISSLKEAQWHVDDSRDTLRRQIAARDNDIARLKIPVLNLEYGRVIADPADAVRSIVRFLGISPTEQQRQDAIAHVSADLRHFGSERGLVDVVYPLGTGSKWQDNELRYSLRSLEKFFPNLGRVFIVGHKPAWLTGVIHIPFADSFRKNKDANLISKVLAACEHPAGLTAKFLRLSDDQLFLKMVRFEEMAPLHLGNLVGRNEKFWSGGWKRKLRTTRDHLQANGFGAIHFDAHAPAPYDRESFVRVMAEHPWRETPMTIGTLYFNAARIPGRKNKGQKATLEHSLNDTEAIRARLADASFFGYSDAGLTPALKSFLAESFPEPSKFEEDVSQSVSASAPTPIILQKTPSPPPIPWTEFLTYGDLARESREIVSRLPAHEIDCVVGAARSGLMPAATIATALHLPLFAVSAAGVVDPGHGRRIPNRFPNPRCVLVVEDTASSGNAIKLAAEQVARRFPRARIIKLAMYASTRGSRSCDLVGRIYERPHFLEWNFPNAWIYANIGYDFDGIFCEDCPPEADDDGPRYEEFLRTAKPKFLPRKYTVKLICTARLEKWRPQTEEWLRRHGIRFEHLAMGPWASLAERRKARDIDCFKAYCLAHSSCYAFAESDPRQAESIMRLSGKPVLCPVVKKFFIPQRYSWTRMSRQLKV